MVWSTNGGPAPLSRAAVFFAEFPRVKSTYDGVRSQERLISRY
jgi:hypothetical protein